MKQYRILPIAHLLKNNVIAKSGDVVSEDRFTAPINELIKGGVIEEVLSAKKEEAPEVDSENQDNEKEEAPEVKKFGRSQSKK